MGKNRKYIIENDLEVGFKMDEFTTIRKITGSFKLFMFQTDACTFLHDLIELYNTPLASIMQMFLSNRRSNGFEDEFLFKKMNFT
jgi:hypothetical protein